MAFYDALAMNGSVEKVLDDEKLCNLAREITAAVRANVSIDWMMRENARARLRVIVKRILRKYGYPPEKQDTVAQTVIEQAEGLSEDWLTA